MSQQNETIICGSCRECVPAGLFCFKCGTKQTAIVKQPSYEGVHTPVQATDNNVQNSGKSDNSSGKVDTVTRQILSSMDKPEAVSAKEANVDLTIETSRSAQTSFTISMKPESSLLQNSGIRNVTVQSDSSVSTAGHAMNDDWGNGVNDVTNAAEKLKKEANKVANEESVGNQ